MEKCSSCGSEVEAQNGQCPKCLGTFGDMSGWVCLTRVSNHIEYEMVAGILQMGDIPVIRKTHGIDGFAEIILGMPIAGIEMYVPEDRFDEAYELINAPISEEDMIMDENENEDGSEAEADEDEDNK